MIEANGSGERLLMETGTHISHCLRTQKEQRQLSPIHNNDGVDWIDVVQGEESLVGVYVGRMTSKSTCFAAFWQNPSSASSSSSTWVNRWIEVEEGPRGMDLFDKVWPGRVMCPIVSWMAGWLSLALNERNEVFPSHSLALFTIPFDSRNRITLLLKSVLLW